MIDYSPFWQTLKLKNISTYTLIEKYGIGSPTIQRLRNNKPISTQTIDTLCQILNCDVQHIIKIHKNSQA